MTQPAIASVNQIGIKIGGSNLALTAMDRLISCQIDQSLGMPDMCVLTFTDDAANPQIVDGTMFDIGKEVEIQLPGSNNALVTLMKGEIVAMQPTFSSDMTIRFKITVYDKSHRLTRNRRYRSFVDVSDSDMVATIAGDNSLTSDIEATTQIYKYQLQANITDMEFLQEIALRNERVLFFNQGKLYFKALTDLGRTQTVTQTWGQTLLEFSPRVSGAAQVTTVNVKAWDMVAKNAVTGTATTAQALPTIGYTKTPASATSNFGSSAHLVAGYYAPSQSAAETIAKKVLYSVNSQFVTAVGTCMGHASMIAGAKVSIQSVGTRFSGTYLISSANHMYSPDGYYVEFAVSGATEPIMADLLNRVETRDVQTWPGVYSAIVTNNNDSDGSATSQNLGRVKLKFPWLKDDVESNWARVITPDGGKERGNMYVPEINDEVLVAFENGDMKRPYVLGGLWNGKDAPPMLASEYVADGKVVQRVIKSRGGHQVLFVEKSDNESILIKDKSGMLSVLLDTTNKKIVINADDSGGMELKSKAGILLDATELIEIKCKNLKSNSTENSEIKATGNIDLKSTGNSNVEATGKLDLKGTGPATLKSSATMMVEGSASTTVQSSGTTTVKGTMVMIN